MGGDLLIVNIGQIIGIHQGTDALAGHGMNQLNTLSNAFLLIRGGKIEGLGQMSELPETDVRIIDAKGGFVLPTWCDSHTHIVFAESREQEMVMRHAGRTYEEIAAAGGGILNSADRLRAMDENELYDKTFLRYQEIKKLGTGAIEIKSGYGLSLEAELKMLKVIRRLKELNEIPIKASLLAAHAFPREYKNDPEGYIDLIQNQILPKVVNEGLADYMDVFCDRGFFSVSQTDRLLESANKQGLRPKIHANELAVSGGVQVGVKHGALSVDHLEEMDEDAIDCLAASDTIGTMLPGCAFFLGIPYPKANQMLNAGAKLALASDFNPGTAPSGNMNFVVSLACIKMHMTPESAINAATFNGACAMELQNTHGSIGIGKIASVIITEPIPNLAYLPYHFGSPVIQTVILSGKVQ